MAAAKTKKKKNDTIHVNGDGSVQNTADSLLQSAQGVEKSRADYINALGSYGSPRLDELYKSISGRKSFTYDPTSDALYQKYRQMYINQGRKAMEDSVGVNSALTGGYASSYAQSQGAKQYGDYLSKLDDILPSLYEKAYGRYVDEGKTLAEMYELEKNRLDEKTGRLKNIYETEKSAYEEEEKRNRQQREDAVSASEKRAEQEEKKQKADEKQESDRKKQEEKANKTARENAMAVLKTGNMPDSETLKKAGISKTEAKQLASYYKQLLNKRLYG